MAHLDDEADADAGAHLSVPSADLSSVAVYPPWCTANVLEVPVRTGSARSTGIVLIGSGRFSPGPQNNQTVFRKAAARGRAYRRAGCRAGGAPPAARRTG